MMLTRRATTVLLTAALTSVGAAAGIIYVFMYRSNQREQSRQMIAASTDSSPMPPVPPKGRAAPPAPIDATNTTVITELTRGRRIAGRLAWWAGVCALGYGAYVAYLITATSRGLDVNAESLGLLMIGLISGAIVLAAIGSRLLRISGDRILVIVPISFVLGMIILTWAIFLRVVSFLDHAGEKSPDAFVSDIMIIIGAYLMFLARTLAERVTTTNDN